MRRIALILFLIFAAPSIAEAGCFRGFTWYPRCYVRHHHHHKHRKAVVVKKKIIVIEKKTPPPAPAPMEGQTPLSGPPIFW
jgi:hypothetical protein